MTPQAQQYYERKLSYVPITGDPLEDYRRRRDRLERELDDVGVKNPESRYQITMRLLGQEPIQQGSFFGERVPAAAGRGADKFGMNVGAMTEYFGRQLESPGVEEFGQEMAARNRQMLDRSPAPYASPEEQEQQGFLRRMDDLLLQAGEETIGSAPAIVPPLAGAAIGGAPGAALGFAGVLGANAALEGGSTYSDRKQFYMRQGMPEDQAAQQAKKEADEVAIANLTDPELIALAGVQGASGAIAKGLLPNAGRVARYGTIGGLQAGSGALQEGRQYEVSETATGNPMEQFTGRFSTPEGRNSMLVGAISEAVPTVAEAALAADPRVDLVATDLRRRTQDAAYDAVSANDALEAQRQEALAAAQQQAALEEAERIQKSQAEEQARQRKEQVQREKDALQLMKLEAQAIRERFRTTNEMARAKNEATPAASSGTSTTATSERTAPTAEQIFSSQQEQRRRATEQTSQIPVPSSPTTTTAPSTADLLAIQQEQQRVAQERAQQATEQQQQQQPEADPEPTIDLAAYEAIQEQERLKEEEAQRVMEMRQQWEDNFRKRQEVLLLPAPAETSASTTEEGPTFQSPRTQELYEQFKTRRRNEATQELRNVDQSQEAQQETFQTPEGQALYDQFKAEKRQQMEQLGMVETPAPMEQEADLRVEDPMETTQENVTPTPEEDTFSTEVGGQVAGQDLVQDQTEPVVEETAPLPERLPAETPAPMEQELEDIPAEVYVSTREPKPSTILATGGQNDLTNGEFDDIHLTSVENYKSPEHGNIKLFELSSGETVPLKKISTKKEAEKYGVPSVGWYRMDKSKDSTDRFTGEVIAQPMRLTELNLKDLKAVTQELIDYRNNRQVDFLNLGTLLGNQRTTYVEYLNRQKTDKAERASNKSLKERIDASLAELNQTDPVVEETAPLPERLPEETLEPTPADELKSDLLQKKEAATQAYEEMDESLFGTKEEDKLDAAMEKADRAYERGLAKAQKEWDKLSATTGKKGTLAPNQLQNAERRTKKLFEDAGLRRSQADPVVYTQKLIEFGKDEIANTTPGEADVVQGRKREEMEDDFGMDDSSGGGMYSGYGDSNQYYDDTDTDLTSELRYSYSATSRPTNAAGPSTKLTARQVKAAMEGVKSVLKKLDPNGDRVTVVANKAEAVAKLQEMGRDRDAAGLANREDSLEEGFTLTDTGNIVLIADQIQGQNLRGAVDRMVEVTFHEALGHAGLRGLMGEKFDGFIKNFGIKNNRKINNWLQTEEGRLYSGDSRNTQIEEYIAKNFAETGAKDVGFVENLVQNVLSSLGLRQYSETALKKIMQQIQQEFVDGNGNIIEGSQRGTRDVEGEEGAEQTAEEKERSKTEKLKEPPARISKKDYNSIVQRVLDDNKDLKPRLYDVEKAVKDVLRNVPSDRRATYLKEQTTDFVVGSGNKAKAKPEEYREIPIESGVSPREALVGRINQELRDRIEYGSAKVRYSSRPTSNLIGGQVPLSNWTTPTESKMDDFIYTMQDKMVDTKRVVESIKEAVGNIDERWNPYLQEELYHGRTAKETKNFLNNELKPLLEDLQRFGVNIKDFDNYLWNRHAEERNIQMAKVNPDMPDGGSGRTTAEARDYLANLSPQKRRVFEQLAQRVDNITSQTRQILKDSSLEAAETVDTWESTYEKYVPLEREEFDFQPMQPGAGIGQGYDVRNPAVRRAVGSERGVIDVLANVALQRERAITRSNKNKVAQAVYGLAAQNPNTDFWLVIDPAGQKDVRQLAQTLQNMGLPADVAENFAKEPVTTTTDTRTGLKVSRINASIRNSDNYLSTRINGQDKFVIFNAKNPSSQRMVRSLKNLDADQLGRVMGILGNVTRWMTSVNTQYNPIFGVVNLLRDVQGALINLTSTPIGNKQAQVAAGTLPALKGIYSTLRGDTARQNQYSQLWEEFQQEGGQTGYKDMFARSDERATALEKELKGLSAGKPMKALRAIRDWLSDYNEAMENAVRLSAYKVAKEQGMTNQQAASLAKNLTVNFNRKGQVATQAGALYSFFNAAVQGTARMMEALRGPAGKKIIYGGLLLGTAQAALLEAADFDEDEPPYFVREKNVIIPLIGGGYLTIPMPLGLNIIPNTSRVITEFALSGFREPTKRVGQITGSLFDAFNPIGNAGWSVQTIAPTVADPLVALSENRDWTGRPIAKEDMVSTRPTPGYTRAKETASTLSTGLAYFLNAASGGTDYQKGLFSPTPDQLDYLVGQAFGGVGRELLKAEQTVTSTFTGEELPPYKIPLAGRFYGNTESSAAASNRFYTNITRLNEHEAEIKGRRENRENVAEYLRDYPEARLASFAGQVERAVRKLQKRKRDMLDRDASRSSIEAIEKLITRRMQTLNDRVERFAEMAD
tara:strand:- start:209 stop:7294 length:7086 start_codon:yes stop_codon:yes gene_type:complete